MQIKDTAKKLLLSMGYEVRKVPTPEERLELYRTNFPPESLSARAFYNIGAGEFRHPYWTNVDNPSEWYSEVQDDDSLIEWDLLAMTPLGVEDSSAEAVFSSHTIEHITDEAAAYMLSECYRILKPGGVFRLTMPDMELAYAAFLRKDIEFFRAFSTPGGKSRIYEIPLYELFLARFANSTTELWAFQGEAPKISKSEFEDIFSNNEFDQAMNACSGKASLEIQKDYPGNHINWWTYSKASRMLHEAGFRTVRKCAYGQSDMAIMRDTRVFDTTFPEISLFVEARR